MNLDFSFIPTAFAKIAIGALPKQTSEAVATGSDVPGGFGMFFSYVGDAILFVIVFFLFLKLIRLVYEIYAARKLVFMRVTLPRADSKLDKEKETKKDFKEKTGIMSIFYKGIHKISEATLAETFLDIIFDHAKISLEIVYDKGQVSFYAVTYNDYVTLISQQITSNYPDAEVKIISREEYGDIKPVGYTLRAASIYKANDDIYPIKTYKYFEDDPLSSLTNNIGNLKKTDHAVFQLIIKPVGSSWNRTAKKAASEVAKGSYKKGLKGGLLITIIQSILSPFYWIAQRLINNEPSAGDSGAPGASSGDSYKIFNQAEQEAQKMVGESAGQPGFQASVRILVASDTPESAESGLYNLVSAMNIYTDEYNNKLDNPQIIENMFAFFFTPIRYLAFRLRLVGLLQTKSMFSTDELSTLYHFPDINYNKSPIIKWLEYKMLTPPNNLRTPKIPTMLMDYIRDKDGHVLTMDGSHLKVDSSWNLIRDAARHFVTTTGEVVTVHADGESKGKPVDEGKTPRQELQQRKIAGFPIYTDGVLMGWNEYRNNKTPIYFTRKDRGRHHYIIGKSG